MMCDRCGKPDLALAAAAVSKLGDFKYWRDPTPLELEFGDVERIATETNDLEVSIASAAKPDAKAIVAEVVKQAMAAVKSGDTVAVASISADHAALAKTLKAATARAVDAGRQQVFAQYRKQTGKKLAALPPRKNPRLSAKYLAGKSEIQAEAVAQKAQTAAKVMAMSQIGRGVDDSETLEQVVSATVEKYLIGVARGEAREGIAVGRLLAAKDTADEIESVVYSALLDTECCDVCFEADQGDPYGPEGLGSAPNPDCIGDQYSENGIVCRCVELIIYQKG